MELLSKLTSIDLEPAVPPSPRIRLPPSWASLAQLVPNAALNVPPPPPPAAGGLRKAFSTVGCCNAVVAGLGGARALRASSSVSCFGAAPIASPHAADAEAPKPAAARLPRTGVGARPGTWTPDATQTESPGRRRRCSAPGDGTP
mmetsp:Transcript_51205/g.134633  ORF Transcript_51205/g.134633 Transcript_51205/m.134633 type:complete len:145 (-) Transcript_51205:174-608(-)|eukprot:553016-Prymnesium_polylepis.1